MKKSMAPSPEAEGTREAFATRREEGLRLDLFLTGAFPSFSRKEAKRLIDGRRVSVNGKLEPMASRLLRAGDRVTARLLPATPGSARELQVSALYEDESCLAVAKPAGLASGPTRARAEQHAQALAEALVSLPLTLLHRLDKETSGILLLAKTPSFAETLLEAFRMRAVEKTYLALVRGTTPPSFHASSRLREGEGGRMHVVAAGGVRAETEFRTVRSKGGYSLVEAHPRTGRTHQIRVQLAAAGHAILGDSLYRGQATARAGERSTPVERQMLHAWKLAFVHPASQRRLELTAPLPADFGALAEELFGRGFSVVSAAKRPEKGLPASSRR